VAPDCLAFSFAVPIAVARRPRTENLDTMVDNLFQRCVDFLVWLAAATGTTYKEINVIIFCVIWPLLTVGLVALCVVQRAHIRRLQRVASPQQEGRGEKTPDRG
jgi:hypothetical protein